MNDKARNGKNASLSPHSGDTNKITYDGVGDTLSILLSKKQIAYMQRSTEQS